MNGAIEANEKSLDVTKNETPMKQMSSNDNSDKTSD